MGSGLAPVTLSPRPSRQIRRYLRALQLFTGLVLVFAPIPIFLKILLLSGLTLHILVSYRRGLGHSSADLQSLRIDSEHRVRLVYADGRVVRKQLLPDSVITPVALLLRYEGGRWWRPACLLLGPDSLSAEELRRLRVLLRFGGKAPGSTQ